MKKFTVALISLVLCLTMAFGAFAADVKPVEASSVTQLTTAEPETTKDAFEDILSSVIDDNKEQAEQVTNFVSGLKTTIAKVLDALDDFLRNFGVVVNQILASIFKNGDLPF